MVLLLYCVCVYIMVMWLMLTYTYYFTTYIDDIFGIVILITHKQPPNSDGQNSSNNSARSRSFSSPNPGYNPNPEVLSKVPIHTVSVKAAGISLHSFLKYVNKRYTKKNRKCNMRFIPLIIDEAHADRSVLLLEEEMVRMDCMNEGIYETPIDFINQKDVKRSIRKHHQLHHHRFPLLPRLLLCTYPYQETVLL